MNAIKLVSLRFKDSYIYINLDISQEVDKFLAKLRSIYIHYKIKAFDTEVKETALVKKKEIIPIHNNLMLRIELHQLHHLEQCQIEIEFLKFNYLSGKKNVVQLNETFSFLEIKSGVDFPHVNQAQTKTKENLDPHSSSSSAPSSIKTSVREEIIENHRKFKQVPLTKGGLMIIEEDTTPAQILDHLEQKIEAQLDPEVKKINMELNQVCYGTLNLILSNLPRPFEMEGFHFGQNLIDSVRRYMDEDLNPSVGGEA